VSLGIERIEEGLRVPANLKLIFVQGTALPPPVH
jgi:hypothetical protein